MIVGIIPARYASTRFPGKPLVEIEGVSMIQRVYQQASRAKSLDYLVVATDDERIANHVRGFGGNVVMTGSNHPSGTDRCYEVVKKLNTSYKYIINIQGDEPFINPEQIDELGAVCKGHTELATQMIKVDSAEFLFDTGEVKIVLNHEMEALYFSRSVIPFLKNIPQEEWHKHHTYYRHVGMYAYRSDVLQAITQKPVSVLERAESLEQLRWLEAGYKIKCVETKFDSHCVDTPEDIERVLKLMKDKA
ncbi:MAG: 3-deoxy-manno-octulosonate cytidylyltransferase [Bacteroidia bacterium]|nr:3-deoxy-manno-octulosonate cytidylyltransferase [Bacteroidia bacterium]